MLSLNKEGYDEEERSADGLNEGHMGQQAHHRDDMVEDANIYKEQVSVWPYTCWTPR